MREKIYLAGKFALRIVRLAGNPASKTQQKHNMNTKRNRWTKADRTARFYRVFSDLGFSYKETETLRRAEMTLHRWHELECGDDNGFRSFHIERDEETGKPFEVSHYHRNGTTARHSVADREKGALRRIAAVLAGKENIAGYYQQTDPRGCALYILRKGDVPEGERAESYYSRGIAVCY